MPFVVFEGLDGCGKSTLLKKLQVFLESNSQKVTVSREPGGTELGRTIRQLLLSHSLDPPVAKAEVLLYLADRAQHVETLIRPSLTQGHWVLSDRFKGSTVAFQEGGRSLQSEQIRQLNDFAVSGCDADLTVLLDLSVEESQSRINQRGGEQDRLESESLEFHQRVRQSFLRQAKEEKNWLVLDAVCTPDELFTNLKSEFKRRGWDEF